MNTSEIDAIRDSKENKTEPDNLFDYDLETYFLKPGQLASHYTSMETFSAIIKTDGFWASQARFSNDDTELTFAKDRFNQWLKKKKVAQAGSLVPDVYMVALCSDDDLLSQWRGYCRDKEGISISFDLSARRPFYLKGPSGISETLYLHVQPVFYNWGRFQKALDQGLLSQLPKIGNNVLFAYPFIKHPKFKEEKEHRLALVNLNNQFGGYIQYRQAESGKIPYIEIRPGIKDGSTRDCNIRLNTDPVREKLLLDAFQAEHVTAAVVRCRDRNPSVAYDDDWCFGCSMRQIEIPNRSKENCAFLHGTACNLSIRQNSVMIAEGKDQKALFEQVSSVVDSLNEKLQKKDKLKIWCEGHLPIRKLRVGNTRKTNDARELIEHICLHGEYYWLKYVDVNITNIPYRPPLKFQ